MTISRSDIVKAFEAQLIRVNPQLLISGYESTAEHVAAWNKVGSEYDTFCNLVLVEMEKWPLTKNYFGHLINQRLRQDCILDSGFISILFDIENFIEERLKRVCSRVANFEHITLGVNAPSGKDKGLETDELVLDLWNEIFVLDVLISQFGFANIEKVVRLKGRTQVDFLGAYNGAQYLIEVTRLRKSEFDGSTLPNMIDAIHSSKNNSKLDSILRNKFKDKNKQIAKFSVACTTIYRKLLVIKTSQDEYQDAREIVKNKAEALFNSGNYPHIQEVLLLYDILPNFHWIR